MNKTDKIKKLLRRAKALDKKIKAAKLLYKEMDELVVDLKALGFKSGLGAVLVDNFAEGNVCFRNVGVKRHELKF